MAEKINIKLEVDNICEIYDAHSVLYNNLGM